MPEKWNFQRCTICGNYKEQEQTWFLTTESCWEDKLNVWKWNQAMAAREAVHSLCRPRHVPELIIHEGQTPLPYRLGEIAVDRKAVSRILVEDPLSLTTLLDELMMPLEQEVVEDTESELQNDLYLPDM
jgi:hypothetical protein